MYGWCYDYSEDEESKEVRVITDKDKGLSKPSDNQYCGSKRKRSEVDSDSVVSHQYEKNNK